MTRQSRRRVGTLLGLVSVIAVACTDGVGQDATEFQRQRSEQVDIVLLSPADGLRHGMDTFFIEFRSASDGDLIDAGVVNGSAEMPMAGMPMMGTLEIAKTDVVGRYQATGDLSMAGTWRLTIRWNGPAGQGSVTFPTSVQ